MWEAASPQLQYKQIRQSPDRSLPHQTDRETVGGGERGRGTERERGRYVHRDGGREREGVE